MASLHWSIFLTVVGLLATLISPTKAAETCTSQKFTNKKVYSNCSSLPYLSAVLHWTYDASNSSLSIVFVAPTPKPDGWIAWAINPKAEGMAGSQALIAYTSNGSIIVKTYNISSYSSIVPAKLSFDVWDTSAEQSNGTIKIFATVKVPEKATEVNQVWQVGPGVDPTNGRIEKHEMKQDNLNAKGVLTLVRNGNSTESPVDYPAQAPAQTGNDKGGVSRIRSGSNLASLYALRFLFLVAVLVIF